MGAAMASNIKNSVERKRRIGYADKCSTRATAPSVARDDPTSRGRRDIQVVGSVNQNVGITRSRITYSKHDLTGKLVLHVDVELLHLAQLEVCVLGQKTPCKIRRDWRGIKNLGTLAETGCCQEDR